MSLAVAEPAASASLAVGRAADGVAWNAYVDQHPDASPYHRWVWRRVFAEAFGHRTRYLAATRDGCIVGTLPVVSFHSALFGRFAVSLPFVNYGGVLADDPAARRALVDAAIATAREEGDRFLELRHTERRCPELVAREHKVAMRLSLSPTVDEQWARVGKKVRNQVRKAERAGLEARIGGAELLDDFYGVFARNMRDLGTPVYGCGVFRAVLEAAGDDARIYRIAQDDRPVAASIVLGFRVGREVPWASSLREANPLCPNMLLYWTMLKDAVQHGCRTFDFGRSTPDGPTYRFKRQWGAEPAPLAWEYWTAPEGAIPDFTPGQGRFRLASALWRRLPVALTRWLGPSIVRNIP